MNRRETVVLALVLIVALGAAIGYFQTRSDPPKRVAPPFFYEIEASDIVSVRVEQGELVESFIWDEAAESWRFDDETKESVDEERWGGMPVLLAGPRIERTLPGGLEPNELGLDPPMTTVFIGLQPSGEFRVAYRTAHAGWQCTLCQAVEQRRRIPGQRCLGRPDIEAGHRTASLG